MSEQTRPCAKCGEHHARRRRSGLQSYCAGCHAAHARATRKRYSELSPEARRKANTRSYTNVLKRRGHLTQGACESCGSTESQAHHPDYTDPRNVNWLCRACHMSMHHTDE